MARDTVSAREGGTEGASEPEILFERRGAAGLVTLNRPRALNALSLAMLRAMHAQLVAWERDEGVTRVVVRGAGTRAFCAGGDIRQIYAAAKAGRTDEVAAFWTAEYGLDALVQAYAKPVVSLIGGIVMGGGNGISLHGSHRVAGEGYLFAMPETGIGFFPDVGMTYALPRLPGRLGTYLALTGARIGAGDALHAGLATHFAASGSFEGIVDGLAGGGDIDGVLAAHAAPAPGPDVLADGRGLIDECFSAESPRDVLGRLDVAASAGSGFAAETAALLRTRSPTGVTLAHALMRRGAEMTFAEAILAEYRVCARSMDGHDFFEGVRAVVIDKDGAPAWRPDALEAVDPAVVAAAFAPLDRPEPDFARPRTIGAFAPTGGRP